MKRLFTLILILFCFAEVKGQILWERMEKDTVTYLDEFSKVMVKDSLIYLNGFGTNTYRVPWPVFYSCYNFNGKLKWRKVGRRSTYYNGQGDLIIDDNNYLATCRYDGNYDPRFPGGFNFYFQKIDLLTGDSLPSTRFTVPWSFKPIPSGVLLKEPKGSYMIGGASYDGPVLAALSSSGAPIWTKGHYWYNSTNHTGFSDFTDFLRKDNGNFVMLGENKTIPGVYHAEHPILIEFKPNGDTLRRRTLVLGHPTFNEVTFFSKLSQARDGGFVFSGRIDTVVDNCHGCDAKFIIAKTDAQFNLEWTYINKGSLRDYRIMRGYELADSTYAFLAWTYTPTQKNHAIIKVSKTGQYSSHTTFTSPTCSGLPLLWDWKILPDGTAIVAGKCKSGYSYLARIAGVGIPAVLGNSKEIENAENYLTEAYPNPANETVTFTYSLPAKVKQAEIRISEIASGKEVKQLPLRISEKQQQTSLANLNSGMYAYTLLVDGIPVSTKKLVVVK